MFDREKYDFMDEDNPVFQYYRSRDDAGNLAILSMGKNSGTINREGNGDSMFPLFLLMLSASHYTV